MKYTIFSICYNPPLSMDAINRIVKSVTPSMSSEDTYQYSLDFLLSAVEELGLDDTDIAVLEDLNRLNVSFIEI